MAKPVYQGTQQEYEKLPQSVRQYYTPPKEAQLSTRQQQLVTQGYTVEQAKKVSKYETYPQEVRQYYLTDTRYPAYTGEAEVDVWKAKSGQIQYLPAPATYVWKAPFTGTVYKTTVPKEEFFRQLPERAYITELTKTPSGYAFSYEMRPEQPSPFYKTLGYPEFAGKYEPFKIPAGYKVAQITETAEGLLIQFAPLDLSWGAWLWTLPPDQFKQAFREHLSEKFSEWFYTDLGYPEFAGKYSTFDIPKGFKVAQITETLEGLQIQFAPLDTTVSLAETLLGFEITPLFQPPSPLPFEQKTQPFAPLFGIVAGFESFTYSAINLAALAFGVEPIKIKPPPVLSSGAISSVILSVKSGQLQMSQELKETLSYGPEYAIGTLFADVLIGYTIGAITAKPIAYVTKKVSSVWRGSRAEMWLIQHSKRYASYASKQISGTQLVSYPQVVTEQGMPVLSPGIIAAQDLAWGLELTKGTSGVTISKFLTEELTKESLLHFFFRHGAISIGYLQQPLAFKKYSDILVPETTEAVTKRAFVGTKLPYIPEVTQTTMQNVFSIFPPSILSFTQQTISEENILKTIVPQTPKRKTKTILRTDLQPILKEEAQTENLLGSLTINVAETETLQLQPQKLTLDVVQKTLQLPKYYPPKQVRIPKAPKLPTYKWELPKRKRRGKDLFGAWFLREHKIATPAQVAKTFGFDVPTQRKPKPKKAKKTK
ncbi:MAG: hypothetical protein OEZ01_16925, partial [Candidatus Heimdallarchaeota archaeon]|nr:hypothetical protein [Candidatus Heimdallarchaeota archaeon]